MGARQEESGLLPYFLSLAFKALFCPAHPPFMELQMFSLGPIFMAQTPPLEAASATPGGRCPSLLEPRLGAWDTVWS